MYRTETSSISGSTSEPEHSPPPPDGSLAMKTWICVICGYRYDGEEPPEICPDCGAPKDKFVEL